MAHLLGPVGTLAKLSPRAVAIFQRYWDGDPNALAPALNEAYREWVRDLDTEVRTLEWYLARESERLGETIDRLAKIETEQARRVLDNCAFEAMREALPERRNMWAAAAAALGLMDIPIEAKARIERTLRSLDPIDLRDLRALSNIVGALDIDGTNRHNSDALRWHKWSTVVTNADAITVSGCARIHTGGFGGGAVLHITPTGHLVLRVMTSWLARRPYPWPVPGRHPPISPEEERLVEETLLNTPGLRAFLDKVRRYARVGRQFITQPGYQSALPDGSVLKGAHLRINIFEPTDRSMVEDLAKATATGTALRVLFGGVIQGADIPGAFVSYVTGNARLLQAIAEDCGNFEWI